VDRKIAPSFLPVISAQLGENCPARVDADPKRFEIASAIGHRPSAPTEQDYFTEYNDYILNVRVVDGVTAAIEHINHYGSAHSTAS